MLIQVWALEQQNETSLNRRGDAVTPSIRPTTTEEVENDQDVFVPWHTKSVDASSEEKIYQRYYHLFKEGELQGLCTAAVEELGIRREVDPTGERHARIVEGYERGNWYCIIDLYSV